MGRTVSYSVVKRNNPLDQDAVPKFYAQAQANGCLLYTSDAADE